MSEQYSEITLERPESGMLVVTVNRAEKRNALSRTCLTELGRAFTQHASDAEIRVAVLTGAGEKAFAAGGDLKDFGAIRTESEADGLFRLANESLQAIRTFPVPTVAALNGIAVGGGAELAVACDFRVAAPGAAIGFVQARLAITSGFGGGADLMRLLGPSRALLHMLRAETLPAEQALEIGLVDAVADADEGLMDCVQRFTKPMRQLPVQVARALKAQAVTARAHTGERERERVEREGFARTWAHNDHWEALDRAFSRKG